MIPAGFPPVAPTVTVADLFGPLAPVAVLAVLMAFVVVLALAAGESWIAARRRMPRHQIGSGGRTWVVSWFRRAV